MTPPLRARIALRWVWLSAAAGGLLGPGCYLSDRGGDAGDAGAWTDGALDASAEPGADGGDGSGGGDGAAACLRWGETRVCGDYCEHPCASSQGCNEYYHICQAYSDPDPRGREHCGVDLGVGSGYCYSGARCAILESWFEPEAGDWHSGACVDDGYCRWLRDGNGPPDVRCRDSEGQPFEDGPPDVPCGTGAFDESGLCGGRCGDTCLLSYVGVGPQRCVGISEERGYGTCTELPVRCNRDNVDTMLPRCSSRWDRFGEDCSCMLLEQTLFPEFAENGWPVVTGTCLAYRDAFPGQVRCMDVDWKER